MDVLILGGTGRARALAQHLVDDGIDAVTSLAGVTASRRPLPGPVRVGGFGGEDGLAVFLHDNGVRVLVDATHPFAGTMTAHAAGAASRLGMPLLRLQAPSWHALPQSRAWTWVADHDRAARAAAALPGAILLTVGRQPVPHYVAPLADRTVIARCIDSPEGPLPSGWTVLCDRGPFDLQGERSLLAGIGVLVSKDSGGSEPDPKLVAAGESGTAVVMIARPAAPGYGDEAATPEQAREWVRDRLDR